MFKKSVQQQLLSYHYSAPRKQLKNNKLNLFGKAIALLDMIPNEGDVLASVIELDLSHNAIISIDNIEQFRNVEFVNLSHNRVIDPLEILKLQKLEKLHTLYLKGNPFLRSKIGLKSLSFLLSLSTDVELVSPQITHLIESYTSKTIQNEYFSHYLHKLQIHIQLINHYQLEDSFINPAYAIFPKIKKIFEQLLKQVNIKRQLIEKIEQSYFEDEKLLTEFLTAKLEETQMNRSQIIKKIYEREEILRNVRSTYNQRVVPKKIVPRPMNIAGVGINHFSPPKLKESRKQAKSSSIYGKPQRKFEERQNSPPKLSTQYLESIPESEQAFLNTLIKLNPLYHLLHSPLPSLKPHQKELLIQNLFMHLKQKLKEIAKYEKKEQEHLKSKEENNELQEYLREMSLQVKSEQEKAGEKLKKLSSICQEESQRVENLCEELAKCQEELAYLKQENNRLHAENKTLSQSLSSFQLREKLEQSIKNRRSNNLKRQFLQKINHKAYHFAQLKMLNELNRKISQKQLKQNIFSFLLQNVSQSKHEKQLRIIMLKKHFRVISTYTHMQRQTSILQLTLRKFLTLQRRKWMFLTMQSQFMKQQSINERVEKSMKKRGKRIKRIVLNTLKQQLQERYLEDEWVEVEQQSKILTMRKFMRSWRNHIFQRNQMEQQGIASVKRNKKYLAVATITENCRQQLTFRAGLLAIESFLEKIRKINGYLKFSRTVSSTLLSRKLKAKKIQTIRQHRYVNWFISTVRDCQVRKRIIVERELELRKRQEAGKFAIQQTKVKRIRTFQSLLNQLRSQLVFKMLTREKNEMKLSNQMKANAAKALLLNLRSLWIQNLKLSSKMQIFRKSPIISNRIKKFLKQLAQPRSSAMTFQSIASRQKLVKTFYRWKFFILWSKMQVYKEKYMELGPQITHISQLQRAVAKEKELLLIEIDEKELLVRDYEKKCEQYEYILHSKDLKYEKLKDIYAETMHQQEMNSTIKLNTNGPAREEDVYVKYLPLDLKNKYSFKTKMSEEDIYSKMPAQSGKTEVSRDSTQKGPLLRNRESFISSFKRF